MAVQFVVLLRHGVAEEKGGSMPDFDRQLTVSGDREIRKVARALARIFPDPDAIYSSPLVRCVETAERVRGAYEEAPSVTTTKVLAPAAPPREMYRILRESKGQHIICVGHEPGLSNLMLELTDMRSGGGIALRKAGCYGIGFKTGRGRLEWMLPPAVLVHRSER